MYVFVSWAHRLVAEEAEATRQAWVNKGKKSKLEEDKQFADSLTPLHCLPEYHEYLQVLQQTNQAQSDLALDELNRNLLAIRFVVPALAKVATYQLARRLPGESKLAVSLAARSFLLNTFPGEWVDRQIAGTHRVTFVGLAGMSQFFTHWAYACGAMGQPLPPDLWRGSPQIELLDDKALREFMEACSFNLPASRQRYDALTLGWLGIGASADRDSALLLSAAYKLGLKGAE